MLIEELTSDGFRERLGLSALPQKAVDTLLMYIYERLDVRINERVKARLTGIQATEIETLFDEGDAAEAFHLMRELVPDYKRLASEEARWVAHELRWQAPAIYAIEMANLGATYDAQFEALDNAERQRSS